MLFSKEEVSEDESTEELFMSDAFDELSDETELLTEDISSLELLSTIEEELLLEEDDDLLEETELLVVAE